MKDTGTLKIHLLYDKLELREIILSVPELKLKKTLHSENEIKNFPKGQHRAVLLIETTRGKRLKHEVRLNVVPGGENRHQFNLFELPEQVLLRPVDSKQQILLNAEIKIENLEAGFRPVRSTDGVPYNLKPGRYEVKLILPDGSTRKFNLEIVEGERVYTIPVLTGEDLRQDHPRVEFSLPVGYRTDDGKWYSTRSINISSAGVCLLQAVEQSASAHPDKVFVRILMPLPELPIECYANVRWSSRKRDRALMGLELVLPDWKKTALRRWLDMAADMHAKAKNIIRR